ncbi:MAG: metalloregulator ArsR/SmtB family transcription factor [Alphaproteobacteria bacterium]|nr:metalloregulator ArsR/SmtB family transcription factor [Alphaproteobacteria bacterium]
MLAQDLTDIETRADMMGRTLKALGNGKRLVILCKLMQAGEMNVSTLAEALGLSQSALSQHLAKMRMEGLVATRRDSQTIWYRLADPRIEDLLGSLHTIYCSKD